MQESKPKREEEHHHPEIPPHILKELLELQKRVGNMNTQAVIVCLFSAKEV